MNNGYRYKGQQEPDPTFLQFLIQALRQGTLQPEPPPPRPVSPILQDPNSSRVAG